MPVADKNAMDIGIALYLSVIQITMIVLIFIIGNWILAMPEPWNIFIIFWIVLVVLSMSNMPKELEKDIAKWGYWRKKVDN